MDQLPAVAKSFATYCAKCEGEKFHVVLSHVNEKSAKIQCEICKKKSTFKVGVVAKKKAGVKSSKKADLAGQKLSEWQGLMESQGTSPTRAYRLNEKFSPQEKIEHPKFGVGFVTASAGERLTALFQDGEKSLVQNRR